MRPPKRSHLLGSLATILLSVLPVCSSALESEKADIVVIGATPSGVAAAVAAARSGASVILLEETNHVGGIVSGGLTNTDIRKHGAVGGLYNEFKHRIRAFYTETYGPNSEQVRTCKDGNMFEPKVAEKIFRDMLSSETNIRLLEKRRVTAAAVTNASGTEHPAQPGKRLDGAAPKDFGPPQKLVALTASAVDNPGSQTEIRARTFIDATYEGDLAALAGVPYRVGRESRDTFKEPHAGNIYLRFKDYNPLPGSTGAADDGIQAFCFRFHLTKNKSNQAPVEKPAAFSREDYKHLLSELEEGKIKRLNQVIQFFEMPNGKFEINSDHPNQDTGVPAESLDLAEENWGWPEAGPAERERIFQRYWSYNEGLVWLLQNDPAVPQSIRQEANQWGFPKDEFTDHRNRPHHLYVRQGRRIWGEYTLTENDAQPIFTTGLPKRQDDGIAVTEFEFDSHAVRKYDPAHPLLRPGYFFIAHDPFQLPYRIMVPKCVDGLLVPVACSTSYVGYQTLRMEPVFMALGEACGIAAQAAQSESKEVRNIDVPKLQREILKRGGVVCYESQPIRPEGL